ncbi:PucR family transcriptional regulator [Microterricola viridarii]|nr:helix-turn-helix domain-containing protein [Microterricola viridarii]
MTAHLGARRVSAIDLITRLDLSHMLPGVALDTREIGGVRLFEPGALAPAEGALVLGVGVQTAEQLADALRECAAAGALALVVREPVSIDAAVQQLAESCGVALLGAPAGTDWIQLASYFVDAPEPARYGLEADAAAADSDLFDLANSIAAVVGGPVTIENPSNRILAFSADQARGDDARKQSVLGHQVPSSYEKILTSSGVFRQIERSAQPVFLPSIGPGVRPRVAVRIRAGRELLGSIWAIVDEPLSEMQSAALVEAAAVASITLFRQRAGSDAARRLRVSEVLDLLEGGVRAKEAAERLGYGSAPTSVLAVGLTDTSTSSIAQEDAVQRLADSLGMYLHQIHALSVAAPIAGTVYAVLPHAQGHPGPEYARRIATTFAERYRRGPSVVIGLGAPVADVTGLQRARAGADRALRVLLWSTGGPRRRLVADAEEVQVESLLLRLSDSLSAERESVTGPLAVLREHDAGSGGSLVETLETWLDAFGDVTAAAGRLGLHPNTFRYRLRRLSEIAAIDLDDPEMRFSLMLQLRLFAATAPGSR